MGKTVKVTRMERSDLLTTSRLCQLVGCSFRMADYWTREGLIAPTVNGRGSGTKRLWTVDRAAVVRVVATLADLRCPARTIRAVVKALEQTPELWATTVLVGPSGRVQPVGVATAGTGWLVDLPAARAWVGAYPIDWPEADRRVS